MRTDVDHRPVTAFQEPTTVEQVISLHRALGDAAVLVAGATDVGVLLRRHRIHPTHLVSLRRVDALRRFEVDGDDLVVGASVTHRSVERSRLVAGSLVALRECCETVGSIQTRNIGTIGGNLCNASPAADTPPVLLALGASVELAGEAGTRSLPLDRFFLDYRRTALAAGEVLTAVRIPLPAAGSGSAFLKLGRRGAMEISIVCVGAFLSIDPEGVCRRAGIGLGSVASTPIKVSEAAAVLEGSEVTPSRLDEAAGLAAQACAPIDDVRGSAAYRKDVTATLVRRALVRALDRARGDTGVTGQ
jgi:carbon-monoxide dehydrogenase medium subunit